MTSPPVCDYEGSNYQTRFWVGQGRDYEDQVERIALRRLLPAVGSRLLDVGAGFGRLADEYAGYDQVILFDYSRSLLREAQTRLGNDPRFIFVAGNWYQMPFAAQTFATLVQVRTIHHAADVPRLFQQLIRLLQPGGHYVLEFANKLNLKALLRYAFRTQKWSPFALDPVEFVDLNFNFHPRWMQQQLHQVGLLSQRRLTVSHYRIPLLKKIVPTAILVSLDSMAQWSGNWWQLAPSVFTLCKSEGVLPALAPTPLFACPSCQTPLPLATSLKPVAGDSDLLPQRNLPTVDKTAVTPTQSPQNGILHCPAAACGHQWALQDGLYDFKVAVDQR